MACITLAWGSVHCWATDEPEAIPPPVEAASPARTSSPRIVLTVPSTPSATETVPTAGAARGATPAPTMKTGPGRSEGIPVNYQPTRRADGRRVVALDIGHTVAHPGCYSATGVGEFNFNKRIVELLAARMRESKEFEPVVVNPNGAEISLYERPRVAARAQAELFLAIHHDAVLDKYLKPWEVNGKKRLYCDDMKGYGVFMSMKNPQAERSLAFAKLLGSSMSGQGFEFSPHHNEAVPGENRPILDQNSGVYEYDDLIVLKSALMPAALLECGVIVNRDEEKSLASLPTQTRIVEAIFRALEAYFKPDAAAAPENAGKNASKLNLDKL